MGKAGITRSLPNDEYQAAINANNPSASNPFITENESNFISRRAGSVSFASGNSKHVSSNSNTYESLAHVLYGGTTAVGAITSIEINAWISAAGGIRQGRVRIVDLNTALVICELTGITVTGEESILDMGTISNLPATSKN
jgi:hypothetical protein